jgi:hypothetical protein
MASSNATSKNPSDSKKRKVGSHKDTDDTEEGSVGAEKKRPGGSGRKNDDKKAFKDYVMKHLEYTEHVRKLDEGKKEGLQAHNKRMYDYLKDKANTRQPQTQEDVNFLQIIDQGKLRSEWKVRNESQMSPIKHH